MRAGSLDGSLDASAIAKQMAARSDKSPPMAATSASMNAMDVGAHLLEAAPAGGTPIEKSTSAPLLHQLAGNRRLADGPITIGVCAMHKKAHSAAMDQTLNRLKSFRSAGQVCGERACCRPRREPYNLPDS